MYLRVCLLFLRPTTTIRQLMWFCMFKCILMYCTYINIWNNTWNAVLYPDIVTGCMQNLIILDAKCRVVKFCRSAPYTFHINKHQTYIVCMYFPKPRVEATIKYFELATKNNIKNHSRNCNLQGIMVSHSLHEEAN